MTTRRTLTIAMLPDWRAALRQAGKAAQADSYQGEMLNFESPGAFFGKLTERRWALVTALLVGPAKFISRWRGSAPWSSSCPEPSAVAPQRQSWR